MRPKIGDIWRFDNGSYCYHLLIVDVLNVWDMCIECTSISLEYGHTSNGVIYYTYPQWKKVA